MSSPVIQRLLEGAPDFNFFQAVRILESLFPGAARPGEGDDLAREAFRIETLNTLAFPASEIHSLLPPKSYGEQRDDLEKAHGKEFDWERPAFDLDLLALVQERRIPARLLVTFMGLYGVSSPLPSYFIDPITLRKVEYFELKKFLDFFGHRFYSLFYRAWKKYRHPLHFDPDGPDSTTLRLVAMTGQWPRRLRTAGREEKPALDLARIPFARFLGSRVRSARGLEQLLRGYFRFPQVRVRSFAPTWFDIPAMTCLGRPGNTLGAGARLGMRMEDRVFSFTVEIGPLPEAEFLAMQISLWRAGEAASGPAPLWERVRAMVDAYLRDPLFFEVRVLLASEVGAAPRLGSDSFRLGGYCWMGSAPRQTVSLRF